MAITGGDWRNTVSFSDLIQILDFHHGLYCKASTDHENEIGVRSGEGCEKVYRGACPPNVFPSHLIRLFQRERANDHDGDPSRYDWEGASLENLYLTRLVRMSVASWQPEIFVELPPAVTFPALFSPHPNPSGL